MNSELKKYKKALELFTEDLKHLGEVYHSLSELLIDETECFVDWPEIEEARCLLHDAYEIILDYQKLQLLWVEEQNNGTI